MSYLWWLAPLTSFMGTGRGEALAKFDLSGMKPGQRAGFVRFGGVYHLLGVHVEPEGTKRLFGMWTGDRLGFFCGRITRP